MNPNEAPFRAKFWPTPQLVSQYPEMADEKISKRPSFGVAFQGGGNRAAPATLGQIRALHDLGWIGDVRYMSAISGGSWTAIPYTYLKTGPTVTASVEAEARFLGQSYSPQEVARYLPALARDPEGNVARMLFPDTSMLAAISDGAVRNRMIRAWLRGRFDEAFSEVLEEIYLAPFGLGRSDPAQPDSLFTWREDDLDHIRQSGRDLEGIKVHIVERDRPYLIVGGVLLTRRTNIRAQHKFRSEMTPLYSGVPRALLGDKTKRLVGGGFVESHGYDHPTRTVIRDAGKTELILVSPQFGNKTDPARLNFSLANVAAVSGAAPVETIVTKPPSAVVLSNFGFPEHFVPIDQKQVPFAKAFARPGEFYQKEWSHGDGGHEDNMGLAPLLARQVENIIVFANSLAPLDKDSIKKCSNLTDTLTQLSALDERDQDHCITKMIGDDIASFFLETPAHGHNKSLRLRETQAAHGNDDLRPLRDLVTVAKDLEDDRLSCKRYDYHPSTAMVGVPYSPTICIAYLGFEPEWIDAVVQAGEAAGEDAKKSIMRTLEVDANGDPGRTSGLGSNGFPHIGTFFDQGLWFINTARARLFALSNLTSWTLKERHAATIREAFSENGLHLR
ncbi:hypothetical protein [Pseudosulfitobacter koreensis]|uniref:Patatin-like phospholipase n=1 Tax=Pseudosulfitobacter koreensis TaxID=2968472 RepID=A0ABT1Z2N9_9RHOB|nr:hypothetical protein [Pseudosulfitobacter koreense]MCR8827376.1 hypothetical protein [Pseudosulfitobacter koreense]